MKALALSVALGWSFAVTALPGAPGPTTAPASAPALVPPVAPEGVQVFRNIWLDAKKRTITFPATVCDSQYPLEFLVCMTGSKEYESLLSSPALPSHIHAALLMLGLRQGIAGHWSGEEETAKFLPPRGGGIQIHLQWRDKEGKVHRDDASSWLNVQEGKKAPRIEQWIFLGSEILPGGRYCADGVEEGGIVSVANLATAVIDVPFSSANAIEDRAFNRNRKAIPADGTAVNVILTAAEGADKSPYARAMLEVDDNGQYCAEGKPLTEQQIAPWARAFVEQHAKGQVVLRLSGLATVDDLVRVRAELRYGGVRDIQEQYLPAERPVLPRTAQQAADALTLWQSNFKNYRDLIRDPALTARDVLDQIEWQTRQADAQKALWHEYGEHLKKSLAEYKASTQPAAK